MRKVCMRLKYGCSTANACRRIMSLKLYIEFPDILWEGTSNNLEKYVVFSTFSLNHNQLSMCKVSINSQTKFILKGSKDKNDDGLKKGFVTFLVCSL